MAQPVTIENDALRVQVYPQIGGKVASVIDKADGYELLFGYPDEIPTTPHYDIPYADAWYAGWDECFPTVGPCAYPSKPYQGIAVPDHGELWGLPTTAVPTNVGVTTVWHGLRFGYRLTRKLYLDGPSVVSEYTLVNLAPFEFKFVWCQHALLSMASPVELSFPGDPDWRPGQDEPGPDAGADTVDLLRPATLPAKGSWKAFGRNPIAAPATVTYPARNRSLTIAYDSADDEPLAAHWGLWISTGGWEGQKQLAVEPTTGRHDQLDRAVADGTAGKVDPAGRREWAVRWTVS